MPSINMIAPRRAEKLRLERDMRRLAMLIIAEMVFAVLLGGWVCTKLFTTRSQIAIRDVEISKLQPVVKQIKEYEASTAKLAPKLKLLGEAQERTLGWYTTLDRLTQSLPQFTYLTRISTGAGPTDTASVTVNITGISPTQTNVGETMMRLHSIPDFDKVDLHFTQPTSLSGVAATEFEIGAATKNSQPAGGAKANGSSQS